MRKTLAAIGCTLLFSASVAQGGEYFIYEDPRGRTILSNIAPGPGAEIVQRYELEEVTDEAIRAAAEREQWFWLGLKTEQLAESYQNLAHSNDRLTQAIIAAVALRESAPGTIVQVEEGFPLMRHRAQMRRFETGRVRQSRPPHTPSTPSRRGARFR